MIQYYLSKQYRRTYKELKFIDIFSEEILVDYHQYSAYLKQKLKIDPSMKIYLKIFSSQDLNSFKIIKILLFLHSWLQKTCILQDKEKILRFLRIILSSADENVESIRSLRTLCEAKITKQNETKDSKVSSYLNEQVQHTKKIYLIENIIRPYVTYLQKLISNFQFYSILKKNSMQMLGNEEIWILLNLFKKLNAVVVNTPVLGKFIKKSFVPLAIAISHALTEDISKFYAKISKYITSLCKKIQTRHRNQQRKQSLIFKQQFDLSSYERGIQQVINLRQDIKELNQNLQIFYSDPLINENLVLDQPIFVDTESKNLCQVIDLIKNHRKQCLTPTFSQQKIEIAMKKEEESVWIKQQKNPSIFSDITNSQDLWTFRINSESPQAKLKDNQFKKQLRWTTQN